VYAILKCDDDARLGCSREADAVNWGAKLEAEDGLVLDIIPDDDL
jgi:hypothetical protein